MTAACDLALEPVAPAAGAARRWVRERLAEFGLEPLTEAVTLLTSEVVTNAVLHAATALRVAVFPDGIGVRVEVRDGSPVSPSHRRHPSTSSLGRGLTMLDALADEWGWRRDGSGKVVWFRVDHARDTWSEVDALDGLLTDPTELAQLPRPADEASALGRYSPEPEPGREEASVQIRLLRLPVQLLVQSQEHHDNLLRELRLLALSGIDPDTGPLDPRLVELVHALGERYATTRARRDEEIDAALARGEPSIDQVFSVPRSAGPVMQRVGVLLDEADGLCEQNLLMTMARPPLLRRFAAWYRDEVVGQCEGRAPRPWDGPVDGPS